jgi:hypothetical protein
LATFNLQRAAHLLQVPEDELQAFEVQDTFNPKNKLAGYLCRHTDIRYGALVIYKINHIIYNIPQIILATPKIHYPFGKTDEHQERQYHFPKDVQKVEVYPKLDGTNICCYSYVDPFGERFITFKTRLQPVLQDQDGTFGNFASLWRELQTADSGLSELCNLARSGELALSFELYGHRNKHLVIYQEPLATRFLFAIEQKTGNILPPSALSTFRNVTTKAEPYLLKASDVIRSQDQLIPTYQRLREETEKNNKKVLQNEEENIEGIEGYVFYVQESSGQWHQFKNKPESIEELHWATGGILKNVLASAAWKVLEAGQELTSETLKKLLLEDFLPHQIASSQNRLDKVIADVYTKVQWRAEVQKAYDACGCFWQEHGKREVMKALSKKFEPSQMKKVFSALREIGIAKEETI